MNGEPPFPPLLIAPNRNTDNTRPSDYNYELQPDNQCKLVSGLKPKDSTEWCKQNPNETEYFEPTGFRRIPLTTCVGGKELDKLSQSHPCPGKEEEYKRKHATSGFAIFLAVTVPFALAAAAGWYVWRNWSGKFGQIRLGDQGASVFEADRPWVRYPVIALSAVAAVVVALPVVAGVVWRGVAALVGRLTGGASPSTGGRGRWSRVGGGGGYRWFKTRDSFGRGAGEYPRVADDAGDGRGEDSVVEV
jgi:hypothetical protein